MPISAALISSKVEKLLSIFMNTLGMNELAGVIRLKQNNKVPELSTNLKCRIPVGRADISKLALSINFKFYHKLISFRLVCKLQ